MTATSQMIYFFGEIDGRFIKNGTTKKPLRKRLHEVQRELHGQYDLLAAVPGSGPNERAVQNYFAAHVAEEFPSKIDTFYAVPELVEYVSWLRAQWFTTIDLDDERRDVPVGWDAWGPKPERRVGRPEEDPERLIQVNRSFKSPLAATAWDWMAMPEEVGEDYYTPPEVVEVAREAMGGIDLDPASHWIANRKLQIETIYHLGRSAFENPWFGKVWLNPPHGDYAPWFERISQFVASGDIEQLCMIAPAWAFTTYQAQPLMREMVSATVVMSPTPKFWGSPTGKEGSNHPHFLIYIGDEVDAFLTAFEPYGIPVEIRSRVGV